MTIKTYNMEAHRFTNININFILEKHHTHQKRHKTKPYYISHKVLRDNIISADYIWAKNHVKNINKIFETMEPLWQTTAANDPLRNMILLGECKKAIKKLYITIKRHHLYWNEAAATTEESET
ncbi:uncharacterized protein LOC122964231 [Acropora millepora]|uniref:uncharacterized protein LOC122964231 n=1 Tax=Acropora millepora TaxID=45264 RepID=UPI001CF2237D|nr:uncharacterized protein LOC122964231 [Acropora millepora]